MRYGVDSRRLDVRDGHHDAHVVRLVSLATVARPPVRIRLAHGLRALAAVLEPAYGG